MNTNNYTGIKLLLGAYLHQDFVDEFPTAMEAVQSFAEAEPPEIVRTAISDIDGLLSDERFLLSPEAVLSELGSYYDPLSEGMTVIEWLRQVQRTLRENRH
jgi:hypothetical protein